MSEAPNDQQASDRPGSDHIGVPRSPAQDTPSTIAYSMCRCLLSSNQVVRHSQGAGPRTGWPARSPRAVPPRSRLARRWVVERSHAWLNRFGKLRWRIERRRACVAFWLTLACIVVVIRLSAERGPSTAGMAALVAADHD